MMKSSNLEKARLLDSKDPLGWARSQFDLPKDVIYLDGNSLGPMLKSVPDRVSRSMHQEWAQGLIRSWNEADWINLPRTIADKIASLIGADPACLTVTDSTSANLFKVLASALQLNDGRQRIVSEKRNFPTDLYMAQGLVDLLGNEHEIALADTDDEIISLIDSNTAVVLVTHVDFRTGRMLDMKTVTEAAHAKGALVIWDLAHSAGAVPVELDMCKADFAVGCGYKYLNGGPGAPAFVYVNNQHIGKVQQPLTGWFSHNSPFDFRDRYDPSPTIDQYLCGTPPVLSMVALDAAMDFWKSIEFSEIRTKSLALTDFFLEALEGYGLTSMFEVLTPLDHDLRGSQISLQFAGDGYAVIQALIARGIIGDFREPNILRFGFAPAYNTFEDVSYAVAGLEDVIALEEWKLPQFRQRKVVT